MEAWADHMLGAALGLQGRYGEAERAFRAALDHFDAVGDVSGLAIVFGDFAIFIRAGGDLEAAARLDLMSRELARTTGTNLIEVSSEAFPSVWFVTKPEHLAPGRYEAIAAEVAGMSLDEMVAYARSLPEAADASRASGQ